MSQITSDHSILPRSSEGGVTIAKAKQLDKLAEIFRIVFRQNISLEEKSQLCFTRIVEACHKKNFAKIKIAVNEAIDLRDGWGLSIFSAILEEGKIKILRKLIKYELAEPLSLGDFNLSLHMAARLPRLDVEDVIPPLLEYIDIDQMDAEGKTSFMRPLRRGIASAVAAYAEPATSHANPKGCASMISGASATGIRRSQSFPRQKIAIPKNARPIEM